MKNSDWRSAAEDGSFVPADSAKIGVVDKILTRMNTPESVSKVLAAPNP